MSARGIRKPRNASARNGLLLNESVVVLVQGWQVEVRLAQLILDREVMTLTDCRSMAFPGHHRVVVHSSVDHLGDALAISVR